MKKSDRYSAMENAYKSYFSVSEYPIYQSGIGVSRVEVKNSKRYPDTDAAKFMVYTYGASIYFVAKGSGLALTPAGEMSANEGDVFVFEKNEPHAWQAYGTLELCVVHTPSWDKNQLKYSDSYGNVIP